MAGKNWRELVHSPEQRRQREALELVSACVAARMLGVTPNRVRQMAAERTIPATKVDDGYCGQFVFRRAEMERIAKGRKEFLECIAAERRPSKWGKAFRHQPSYQRAVARHVAPTDAEVTP